MPIPSTRATKIASNEERRNLLLNDIQSRSPNIDICSTLRLNHSIIGPTSTRYAETWLYKQVTPDNPPHNTANSPNVDLIDNYTVAPDVDLMAAFIKIESFCKQVLQADTQKRSRRLHNNTEESNEVIEGQNIYNVWCVYICECHWILMTP